VEFSHDDVATDPKGLATAATSALWALGGAEYATGLWKPNSEKIAAMSAEMKEATPQL
jgi:hypothetical protein